MIFDAGIVAAQQPYSPGLAAAFHDGSAAIRVLVPSPHFHLMPEQSLHPSLGAAFTAEWQGFILVARNGSYQFDSQAASLRINGRAIAKGTAVSLPSGHHPVAIRFERRAGSATLRLLWRSESFGWEPVPSSVFFHLPAQAPPARERQMEQGRELAGSLGCINCHRSGSWNSPAPDLTGIGSRSSAAWIHAWLENPQSFRAGARMPVMLDARARADVTAYLADLGGNAPATPRRRTSEVEVGKGAELAGTIGCLACHHEPGLKLQWLGSKYNAAALAAYLRDPSKVEPTGVMPSMQLSETGAAAIAAYLVTSRNPDFERTPPAGDALRGRQLVETQGCLACHAISGTAASAPRAPSLANLRGGGCLSPQPAAALPRYALTSAQREALEAFLVHYRAHPDRSPAPIYRLRRALVSMRCIACHRTDSGGPSATLPESVPSLDAAGGKLTITWLREVLSGGKRLHGGHELRMPHYTPAQSNSWPQAFASAEGLDPIGESDSVPVTSAQRETGLGLLGTNAAKQGLGCIGCHDWGENRSLGEEGPQLINAGTRLRWDWFERWMLDPARILSGTSMPAYFRAMEHGRARERILSFWAAMSIGPGAPAPEGYRIGTAGLDGEARPAPGKESIIIRWDMPEATPAAIAVGLPGGRFSYCFDAGECRLRYAWQGGFLDMSGTLLRKTDKNRLTPTAELIGEIFYREAAFPIRVGSPDNIPQRRFRGYRIVGGVPEFHYQIGGMEVFEKIEPAAGGTGLRRTLRMKPVEGPVWFVGDGVQPRLVPASRESVVEQVLHP